MIILIYSLSMIFNGTAVVLIEEITIFATIIKTNAQ